MKVRNLNGTNQLTCENGTWLAQWEIMSGQNAFLCSVKDCIRRPSMGGLVQKDSGREGGWYIVPLCASCNGHRKEDLEIWDLVKLVEVIDAKMEQMAFPRRAHGERWLGATV
jgi:hypothetical protein